MSGPRKAAKPKPVVPGKAEHLARLCGTIAGIDGKVALVGEALLDIGARCQSIIKLDEKVSVLTASESAKLCAIAELCSERFDELLKFRPEITAMTIRSRDWLQ